jgi:hypothetical protein
MRAWMILPLAAAVFLAGCQGSDTGPANAATEPNTAQAAGNGQAQGNAAATVIAMSDRQRNVVFIRAMLDAGLPCQEVTGSTRMPDQNGNPMWRATCSDGASHMISITPDGTANIVSRTDR